MRDEAFKRGVTPFAGVWIEIDVTEIPRPDNAVTPFAGVWIEMLFDIGKNPVGIVTPFAGVWIEMKASHRLDQHHPGHSLRGSVD